MNLIILAAGKGIRLDTHLCGTPKFLLSIQKNIPYLWFQLESFAKFEFSKKIIVGGYAIEDLRDFLKNHGFDDYALVNNEDYDRGNLYSLKAALSHITGDFFIFNADHYYSMENYQKIFLRKTQITIFCDRDRVLQRDDMKVLLYGNEPNKFRYLSKEMKNSSLGYVGVTYVPQGKIPTYREAVEKTANLMGDDANVEGVLNTLASEGENIDVVDISGSWWVEIDTPEDLKRAKSIISQKVLKQ